MSTIEGSDTPMEALQSPASTDKKGDDKPCLNEREQKLLNIAVLYCLKGGPPEIDHDKFKQYGEFNTMKTAQNTWGKIKNKLLAAAGGATPKQDGEGLEGDGPATPKTPKSKSTPRKRTKAAADSGDGDEETPRAKKLKAGSMAVKTEDDNA